MNYPGGQAPEPRPSIRQRIRNSLVPLPDPDPRVKKRGFGWGWLVFMAVLGIALLKSLGSLPLAKTDRGIILVISLPVSAVIYLLIRKLIIGRGHYGNGAWIGSVWAGLVALLFCAFVVGFNLGLAGRLLSARNGMRTEEPQKVFVEGQYFTVGSTREEVLRIQGPPTLKLEFVWYYDDSYVQFDSDGKVNDVWNYSKNLKVKPWKLP